MFYYFLHKRLLFILNNNICLNLIEYLIKKVTLNMNAICDSNNDQLFIFLENYSIFPKPMAAAILFI